MYIASVVKVTTQLIAYRVFRMKIIFLLCINALAYYNAVNGAFVNTFLTLNPRTLDKTAG
jgi:hypothetical protein